MRIQKVISSLVCMAILAGTAAPVLASSDPKEGRLPAQAPSKKSEISEEDADVALFGGDAQSPGIPQGNPAAEGILPKKIKKQKGTKSVWLIPSSQERNYETLERVRQGAIESIELRYNLAENCNGCIGVFFEALYHPGGGAKAVALGGDVLNETSDKSKTFAGERVGLSYDDYASTSELLKSNFEKLWGKAGFVRTGLQGAAVVGSIWGAYHLLHKIQDMNPESAEATVKGWKRLAAFFAKKRFVRSAATNLKAAGKTILDYNTANPKGGFSFQQMMVVTAELAILKTIYTDSGDKLDRLVLGAEDAELDFLNGMLIKAGRHVADGSPLLLSTIDTEKTIEMFEQLKGEQQLQGSQQPAQSEEPVYGPASDMLPLSKTEMSAAKTAFSKLFTKYRVNHSADADLND